MNTYVAIGANAIRDYQFITPLSALIWRDRIGFDPIVLKCDDWEENNRGTVALKALEALKIETVSLPPLVGYQSHSLAQNCREFAACLSHLDQDAWLMPTDADLWPVRKEFYQQHQNGPLVTCYYGNGDHYQTIPTCHVTMRVSTWREAYGIFPGNDITTHVQNALDRWVPNYPTRWPMWKDKNFAIWMSDQAIVSEKVFEIQKKDPASVRMIERRGHPPVDRLDRGVWPETYDIKDYVDAHLIRPSDDPKNWAKTGELFKRLLPQYANWADSYAKEYWDAYNP